MKQLKKTILTLALLLTAATGAWAQSAVASIGSENYTTLQAAFTAAETGQTIKLLSDVTQTGGVGKSDGKAVTFDLNGHIYTCTDDYSVMATNNSQITIIDSSTGTPGGIKSELALVGQENGKIIIKAGRYNIGGSTAEQLLEYFPSWCVEMYSGYTLQDITPADAQGFCVGVVAPAPSGPEVAWDAATKTGTFTQPAGNVTVSVEYYPQATLAFQGLTAAEDAAAKTDAPLAVLADGAVTGGTLMYYVATDKNFSQADAIALAETQWSAAIPTAETVEAAGTCYVWYYIKGDAEHSDTDPVPLAVTLLPEPTYAVTFAEGTPETDKWTASPNTGVKKGTAVTVTYTGSKKVIGVKAEKKEAAPASLIVNPVVGQVIGSDGKNYAYASLPTGVTAVAKICYVSGSNGLALALTDEGKMNWSTAQTTCAAHTPAITGGMWKLATKDEWNNMINAADSYDALRDGFSSVGGTNMQSDYYWSSTEADSLRAWDYRFVGGYWYDGIKTTEKVARACLAF